MKYNRALKRKYNERNTIDPISLKDIDDSNEWLIGRMEDEAFHGGAQDDFVFDDDNLTWGDVARATGAEEARFDTRARARASSSIIPPTRGIASSSRTLPSHSLIDEDEDGDMIDSADEEDGEGYKSIWIWICFYAWSSLFLCFLLIKLKFWVIFDNLCV
ncbi:unnamed protein product, partial [Vitis vinifera]